MGLSGSVEDLPRHVETTASALERTILERVGGELMKRERKQLRRLVRKRNWRAGNDNALSVWRDANAQRVPLAQSR